MLVGLTALLLATAPAGASEAKEAALVRGGYAASFGAAMLPPTASRGLVTSLTYYEYSGPFARILALASRNPLPPKTEVELLDVELECERFYDNCHFVYTYQFTYPSAADWSRYVSDLDHFDEVAHGILHNGVPIEVSFDIASPYLGGDAWGGQFLVSRRFQKLGWAGLPVVRVNVGVGAGGYIFSDLARTEVSAGDDGVLTSAEVTDDYQYTFVGMPLRITAFPIPWVAPFAQYDLNVLSALRDRDHQPSPLHAGLEFYLKFVYLRAEVVTTVRQPGALSFGGEVGFGG
ncbi:MAG: hypothetical protein ABIO70_11650 [Pseudomonadota bacterium]